MRIHSHGMKNGNQIVHTVIKLNERANFYWVDITPPALIRNFCDTSVRRDLFAVANFLVLTFGINL